MSASAVPHDLSKVTITVLTNALESRRYERETIELPDWGQSIAQALPAQVKRDGSWVAVMSGKVVPAELWDETLLAPGAEVLCYPKLEDETVRDVLIGAFFPPYGVVRGLQAGGVPDTIIAPLVGGYAGIAYNTIAAAIAGGPSAPLLPSSGSSRGNQSETSSPTYGWQGIKNSTRLGAPISVVFGTHSAYPPAGAQTAKRGELENAEHDAEQSVQTDTPESFILERAA